MNTRKILIGTCLCFAFANYCFATDNKVDVTYMTCEDFMGLKSEYKPTAIVLAGSNNENGKPINTIIDVSGIDKISPVIIEACKENPHSKFGEVVQSAWKDIKDEL